MSSGELLLTRPVIKANFLCVSQGRTATNEQRTTQVEERSLGRVLDFLRLLWAVDHGLQSSSKRMYARYGVTGLQRMMIRVLGRFPGLTAGEVARMLHIHPSTMTGPLEKLVKSGAILRRVDDEDARRARLSLGASGRAIDAIRTGTVEANVRRALANVPERDLRVAANVLSKLADALEATE
jgi:MarR family transcriptional regulator, organic hydroperoxide resistance regulator